MEFYIRAAIVALGILILQSTFIPFLAIGGYSPDLFVIWIVYMAIRRGQIDATAAGFVVGLLQDLVSTQFFGLGALAKTVCGFTAGYFFNENNTEQILGSYRFMLITGLSSAVHNLVYFTLFFQGISDTVLIDVMRVSGATTVYTMFISLLPMFVFTRKHGLLS